MAFLSSSKAEQIPHRRGLAFARTNPTRGRYGGGGVCERDYCRCMWVIQEVIRADKMTVWCGFLSFDRVAAFNRLYATLKTTDSNRWLNHQPFGDDVFHSFAFTMAWQRAYWRHPGTSLPTLRRVSEVLRYWKRSDSRDHVYALVGMATKETASRTILDRHGGYIMMCCFLIAVMSFVTSVKSMTLFSGLVGLGKGLTLRDMYE